ncbi:MAG: LysE family transporter [Coriobacteriia bacterium]|nr:LysE family transporter [Coriobacteriia bacterium]
MSDAASLLLRTYIVGIAVAAPVGAMGVLCIQRVLAHGWRGGLATGLGIATADGLYAGFAAFGVSAVSQYLIILQAPLRIGGGVVLLWLGWRAIVTPPAHDAAKVADASRFGVLYASAVGLTLTNPMTVMAFAAVFASAGLVAQPGLGSALLATAGVAAGSLSWWVVLSTGTAMARHAAGDTLLVWVNRVSGAVIALFGVIALIAGVTALN